MLVVAMTPETILEQSKRARIAQECGFVSYARDIKQPVVPDTYLRDRQRTARVANYLAEVFASGSVELDLHDKDKNSRPVVAYMALYALSKYGFQTASILNVRDAISSDLYAEAAIKRITALKKERAATDGTHLVIADCRVPKISIAQERRFNAIYEATHDSEGSETYRAIIPVQHKIDVAQLATAAPDSVYLEPAVS